jgi:hypothetical protein
MYEEALVIGRDIGKKEDTGHALNNLAEIRGAHPRDSGQVGGGEEEPGIRSRPGETSWSRRPGV